MKPCEIEGWMDHDEIEWLSQAGERMPADAICVEVGCFMGRSTAAFLQRAPAFKMFVVDTFDGRGTVREAEMRALGQTAFRKKFEENIRNSCSGERAIEVFMGTSLAAAQGFDDESVDWVFIDASHDLYSVSADLQAWWPKLKPGGTIAGHDFDPSWPSVVLAVKGYFRGRRPVANPVHAIWAVKK